MKIYGESVREQMEKYGSIQECPECASEFIIQRDSGAIECGWCYRRIMR